MVERLIGKGGMGVVYEAFDRQRNARVALKKLRLDGPDALYRFKREFRALADMQHPNLVRLYELVSMADEWFFTMELIRGVPFLQFVRPGGEGEDADDGGDTGTAGESTASLATGPTRTGPPRRARPRGRLDERRLRHALGQLAGGVFALHRAGKLHRDLKPSNVLVEGGGRVVICDFGLVADFTPEDGHQSHQGRVVGTALYMSPEQGAAAPLVEASDWYSVGVMLYEALVGRPPFEGRDRDVLLRKQVFAPPGPAAVVPGVPADLDQLCLALLRPRPGDRPDGPEVLARLGIAAGDHSAPVTRSSHPAPFVGRDRELVALRDAWSAAQRGGSVQVYVRGASGVGKTALVRRFLDEVAADGEAIILQGRCYERESVPYNALDSLIDSLSALLADQPEAEQRRIVPADAITLTRLFPVLKRVEALGAPLVSGFDAPDPQEARRRAVAALRTILARLADSRPLLLHIDDLQWGDRDSATLLADLLRPPEAPPLLFIACQRGEEGADSPALAVLPPAGDGRQGAVDVRELPLDALPFADAHRLAKALLWAEPGQPELADTVARESGGHPFFIDELARHLRAGAGSGPGAGAIRLDDVLRQHLEALPGDARRLLAVVAVAGRPVAPAVASRAAGLGEGATMALATLRAERLVRTHGVRERESIETYHDRIRDAAVRSLARDEIRAHHGSLAAALEAAGAADPEALAEHFLGAAQEEKAAHYAALAGDQAAEALAFDRAAWLYRIALDHGKGDAAARSILRARLGDALASAGRGPQAASAYLEATEAASSSAALELRRQAAEQLLRAGHFEAGLAVINQVLGALRMRLARTPTRALLSLVLRRLQIRLRGLGFRERDPTEVSAAELSRIDVCWSIASTLTMSDTIRGNDFQTRHLLLALRAGEPYRIARGLAMEAAYAAQAGGRGARRTDALLAAAARLAEQTRNAHAFGLTQLVAGTARYLRGEWREAADLCGQADVLLRDRCINVRLEIDVAQLFEVGSLVGLGELGRVVPLVMTRLREAEARSDLYAATLLRTGRSNVAWLALDQPAEARRQVLAAEQLRAREGFHIQHFYELWAHLLIDLYEGQGVAAHQRITEVWARLRRSLLLRVQNIRIEVDCLRARSALAAARYTGNLRLLTIAERHAKRIQREKMPWSDPLAVLLRAGVAWLRRQPERAAELCDAAAAGFIRADMALHAACCRRRRGELLGGDEGARLVDEAGRWMAGQSISNPARMTDMLAPGFGVPSPDAPDRALAAGAFDADHGA